MGENEYAAHDELLGKLQKIFPEAFNEGRLDSSRLLESVYDVLMVAGIRNYRQPPQVTWPGKHKTIEAVRKNFQGTLKFEGQHQASYHSDYFISGESIEILKIFQRNIDYGTQLIYFNSALPSFGDFILNYHQQTRLEAYLNFLDGHDSGNNWPLSQLESQNFWLDYIYSNLYLCHELLSDSGLIFVSMDLESSWVTRAVLNELFEARNYVTSFLWEKSTESDDLNHAPEVFLVYGKDISRYWPKAIRGTRSLEAPFHNPDDDPRGPWTPISIVQESVLLGGLFGRQRGSRPLEIGGKTFELPEGKIWLVNQEELSSLYADGRICLEGDEQPYPMLKRFLNEGHQHLIPEKIWRVEDVGSVEDARREYREYIGVEDDRNIPRTVKPVKLFKRMIEAALPDDRNNYFDEKIIDIGSHGALAQAHYELANETRPAHGVFTIALQQPLPNPDSQAQTYSDHVRTRIIKAFEVNAPRYVGLLEYSLAPSKIKNWGNIKYLSQMIPEDEDGNVLPEAQRPYIDGDLSDEEIENELLRRIGYGFKCIFEEMRGVECANVSLVSDSHQSLFFILCLDKTIPSEIMIEMDVDKDFRLPMVIRKGAMDEQTLRLMKKYQDIIEL